MKTELCNYVCQHCENKSEGKLLDVLIDINFETSILSIETAKNLPAQKINIMTSLIKSPPKYCPLVWMFCGRLSNNRIHDFLEKVLRAVFNDNTSYCEAL